MKPSPRSASAQRPALVRSIAGLLILIGSVLSGPLAAQPDADAEARALFEQAERVHESDVRRSAVLAERALALAIRGEDRGLERRIASHLCMSVTSFAPARGQALADTRLRMAQEQNDRLATANFLLCKAYGVEVGGDMAAAAVFYDRAMRAALATGDPKTIAHAYAYRGENRHYQGSYDEALIDLDRAFALYTRLGDHAGRRYALNAMANLYSDPQVGEFDKAIEYYRELLAADEKAGAKASVATTLFNIASAHEEKRDFDAALRDYRRAFEIDRGLGADESVAEGQRAIGRVLLEQGRPDEALPMIDRALSYFIEQGNADDQARTRITRAAALRQSGRLDDAMRAIDLSLAHFAKVENLRYLAQVHEERAKILAARGEWRAAYLEAKALRDVETRLERGLLKERVSRLRVQFDAARKEEQNNALQADNQRKLVELDSAHRTRNLQALAIVLGSALLLLIGTMALQQLSRNRSMRSLAMTDDLTGMPNRRHILEYFDEQRRAALESGQKLCLIAFDIDHFKRINDEHGHDGGDRVLATLSRVVRPYVRASDRVGRVGGEEFLAVLPETSLHDAHAIAERLRATIANARLEGLPADARVTASFGVAECLPNDEDAKAVLKRADDALYRAKREGRNRVVVG
jgi:diguanylate cyclase (GGDEF)-like protein